MSKGSRLVTLLGLLIASPVLAQPTEPAPSPTPAPTTPPTTTEPAPAPAPAPAPTEPTTQTPTPTPTAEPGAAGQPAYSVPLPQQGQPATPPAHFKTKWDTTFYGFVEADSIYDSTQGFNDSAGNAAIARPNTYTGDHGQTTFGARNSRVGFKLGAPEYYGVKASAMLEMDFLGNQPTTASESQFWQNPAMRFRHYNVKLETPVLDFLIGQYWELFGWQSYFHPATVEIQGVPGQVYNRSPQIRIGKTIKTGVVDVDIAVAAVRPAERDSATPDGQAGIKVSFPMLKAWHTGGSVSSALDSAAVGVSVIGRRFAVNPFPSGDSQVTKNGYGISLDAMVPIIPGHKENHDNALTLTASYADGAGIADQYTGLSGGVGEPAVPNPGMLATAPTYTPNLDNGLALFFKDADGTYSLHPIQWQSFIVGLQYYLPAGNVFVTANYSHMSSDNAADFGAAGKVFNSSDWADGNLFWDATPAVRLGLEFAWFQQGYVDGVTATNYRTQFSAFFIF
ncbi:MAG TPA: hypothetical protein VH143_14360 [Kofleriaceae bacterium]|nr:hypothetical protein [Kofleriaceae bacterium]